MFRDVRFTVSSEGALKGVSGDIREGPWRREGCLLDAGLSCLELVKLLFGGL